MSSSRFSLAIAPMMGYTDIHFLKLIDLLLPGVDLYQEMIVAQAFIRNNYLSKSEIGLSGRLVLQLGGSDPALLHDCCVKALSLGYDAVNLNVGCPSSRVVSGKIGAVLLKDINLVVDCISSMLSSSMQVSVKTRLGIDNDPDVLDDLCCLLLDAGCFELILHARRAWLDGLNPRQNRDIPPLDYERVCALKQDFPSMFIMLNGGVNSLDVINRYIGFVDGFMLGRMFYSDPIMICNMARIMGFYDGVQLESALISYLDYSESMSNKGISPRVTLRHIINIFKGFRGAKNARSEITNAMGTGKINYSKIRDYAFELITSIRRVD